MIQFSIITVCLNAENCIRETIQSVLNQTTSNFEYIIKDGVSSDETVNIAQSFSPAFAEKGISYRILSQKDSGIYDAMNQAVSEVRGQWVIFMNAGDWFASDSVLERVGTSGCLQGADVVYGDRILHNHNLFRYLKARALEDIRFGLPFGHQSAFTSVKLFENNQYSLRYRICADHEFYLRMYMEGKKFVYFPDAISIYDINGLSANKKLGSKDALQILEDMPVRDEEAIRREKEKRSRKQRQEFMHQHLWRFIPKPLREKRRERMYRKAGWKTEEEFFGTKKDNP